MKRHADFALIAQLTGNVRYLLYLVVLPSHRERTATDGKKISCSLEWQFVGVHPEGASGVAHLHFSAAKRLKAPFCNGNLTQN